MRFEDIVPSIPLDEAAEYFLKLKYAGARQPSEEQVVEAFKGLSKEAQAEVLAEAGITKEAIIGPLADLNGLGVPSLVGYHLGKSQGSAMARAGDPMDERSMAAAMLVPGALGYRYGKTTGYEEEKAKGKKKEAAQEPTLEEYLAQEQQGMAAQKDVERQYLGQRVQDLGSEVQMGQQSAQATSMQMEQMQQQLAQSNQQIQMAQQTAAMAQQQALQAQQQQLQKADESLRTQQMAAQMRMAYQSLREQLMNLATNDPAMSVGNELKGQTPEMGPDGMGAPPGAPPTNDPGTEGQPGATQAPDTVSPVDGASNAPPRPGPGEQLAAKTAGLKDAVTPFHAMGVTGGAAAGGLLANREIESGPERHKASLAKLQGEAGAGGFLNALQQAKAKALLAFSEAAREHPTAARVAGTAVGGAMGAAAGESLKGLMTTPKY